MAGEPVVARVPGKMLPLWKLIRRCQNVYIYLCVMDGDRSTGAGDERARPSVPSPLFHNRSRHIWFSRDGWLTGIYA